MPRQFDNVGTMYGAPMGRCSASDLRLTYGGVRLFRVRLDAGGYDDGGAYWGHGLPLWCAQDSDGDRQFIRATTRMRAAFMLGIPPQALTRALPAADTVAWCYAMMDGRAPFPVLAGGEKATREDVYWWLELGRTVAAEAARGTARAA
jgi:hypothetical protein